MARTMNDEEMTEFVGWVESHHPEIISEFELRDVTLDTADSTPFPLKFSPAQERVLEQIWLVMGRDDRHARGVFSMNWEEIPYIGADIRKEMDRGYHERHERLNLWDIVTDGDVFPLDKNFVDEFFGDSKQLRERFSKMTNGQINEILLFIRDEANTSVDYDW